MRFLYCRREGKWNGGFAPCGYALESGELVIAENESNIFRMIFDRYINTDDGIKECMVKLPTHETVVLLQRVSNTRPKAITLDAEMEDFYRIKGARTND